MEATTINNSTWPIYFLFDVLVYSYPLAIIREVNFYLFILKSTQVPCFRYWTAVSGIQCSNSGEDWI